MIETIPVKFYGVFGKFRPVELQLDEEIIKQFKRESLLELEERCYEIISLFKSGPQLYINLKLLPNPHLYEPRRLLSLP